MEPSDTDDHKIRLHAINEKLIKREMQLHLILGILDSRELLGSKILASVKPDIGKQFSYRDLELKKTAILIDARLRILKECSVVEANRDIVKLGQQMNKLLKPVEDSGPTLQSLRNKADKARERIRKTHQKKIQFHLNKQGKEANPPSSNSKRKKWRKISAEKKKAGRKRYQKNKQNRKKLWLEQRVKEISSTVVRNLSHVEVPDTAYLYLAKGLNFVESKKASKEDLQYDTKEFLRKVSWKAFFHDNPTENNSFNEDEHPGLRIPSRRHPEYSNPLFDEIKTKLMGFVNSFTPSDPKSNLTPAERRGKAWILKHIEDEKIFVTKADKGGSTLILDYKEAVECVQRNLGDRENFALSPMSVEEKMTDVKNNVKDAVLLALSEGKITEKDKKLITGLNENNNQMHAHVFKPVVPYVYPLFKLHKLSPQQIEEKMVPPTRLVHATKEGPLYRLEKWVSPYLTDVSRIYCQQEFLLDTPDLLSNIKDLNESADMSKYSNINLFTLDVISLYPSIKPEIAMSALEHALNGSAMNDKRKSVLKTFTEMVFTNSFVTFQENVYTGRKGIPTGNCISRQVADIMLHWVLFINICPEMNQLWSLILFWRRFIDDIFGIWKGSRRQFDLFVSKLNEAAKPFGIQFGDCQFGKSVNYLDVELTLGENNNIEYRLFKKETDARLYLNTDSFHPDHVFKSVVFSQMIRVIKRNSQDHTCVEDLEELKEDLMKSGHKEGTLTKTEPEAVLRSIEHELYEREEKKPITDKVVFSVKYFKEVTELRKLVHSTSEDIKQLCGDVQILFALRKQPSIGNTVVRNRKLSSCSETDSITISQKCGGRGCATCPQLFNSNEVITVNGLVLALDFRLTCKDSNIIYVAQCQICNKLPQSLKDDTYFGQTVSPFHIRMNGHRNKFKIDNELSFEKSALSMHCFLAHKSDFNMGIFKLGIVKKVRPTALDREESILISKFRTNIFGLNRIVVTR